MSVFALVGLSAQAARKRRSAALRLALFAGSLFDDYLFTFLNVTGNNLAVSSIGDPQNNGDRDRLSLR